MSVSTAFWLHEHTRDETLEGIYPLFGYFCNEAKLYVACA